MSNSKPDPDAEKGVIVEEIPGELEYRVTEEALGEDNYLATLMDPCVNLKNFFVIVVYAFWVFVCIFSIMMMCAVGERFEMEIAEGFKYYVELTEEEAV